MELVSAQQRYINRRITISKIDQSICEAQLGAYFREFGEVESVLFLTTEDKSTSLATAQIVFSTQSSAEKAKQRTQHSINGFRIQVKKTESKNEKRHKQILEGVYLDA